MTESMPLQVKKGSSLKKVVFYKDKITEIEDSDYNFLKEKDAFKFLINEGTFVLQAEKEKESEDKEAKKPSKLEQAIAKMQGQKEAQEAKGKKFHHKAQKKLNDLLAELEDAKTRQS